MEITQHLVLLPQLAVVAVVTTAVTLHKEQVALVVQVVADRVTITSITQAVLVRLDKATMVVTVALI
jgi:hypothetical protein